MNDNEIIEKQNKVSEYLDIIASLSAVGIYETQPIDVMHTIYDKIDLLKKEISDLSKRT